MVQSIVEAVAAHAARTPDALCVVDALGEWRYAEIWRRTRGLAQRLSSLGLARGDALAVECAQDSRFLLCALACGLRGVLFVPLEKRAMPERVARIVEETEAKLLITVNEPTHPPCRAMSYDALMSDWNEVGEDTMPAAGDPAEVLYTTGTTGMAKGIEMSHGANVAVAQNIQLGVRMRPDNRELLPLPLSHSHALRCCYAALLNGSAVLLADGITNPARLFRLIQEYRATAMDFSPTAMTMLMKLTGKKLAEIADQLDYVQVGTEFLSESLKAQMNESFPNARLYNFYGSTESGRTCVLDFHEHRNKPGCIGLPACNARFMVVDEQGQPIASSRENTGLLASAGAMNMTGYWKHPELTAQVMRGGYVYTRDEAYIDAEGFVYVLGRKDDVINYKGIKISPDEIETAVSRHPNVADCACIPVKDKVAGVMPKVFVKAKAPEAFDAADLLRFLRTQLEANKMPTLVEQIDEIPRAYNGKLQRKRLMELEEKRRG